MLNPQVLVVGAGPCGSTIGNLLGAYGVRTLVVDRAPGIIPYPRAVGVDDESLRAFQSAGLAETLHGDMIENQLLRYFDSRGRSLADIAPSDRPFGWPRRNSFLQPLLDARLRRGLERFPHVELQTDVEVVGIRQSASSVAVDLLGPDRAATTVEADYVVGADGGRSTVRTLIGSHLEGSTSGTRWLVVDIENSPLHAPYAANFISSRRPYVSIDLPYGFRRFEFRLDADEPDEVALQPEFVTRLIRERFDWPGDIVLTERARIYSHHSRVADRFASGRVFLAGDAAHLQPPWFGQGMNSGIRDAANISWKLAAVLAHGATPDILDSYEAERRGHATDMVRLATFMGKIYSPKTRFGESVRSVGLRAMRGFPRARDYITSMRFKPMPRYTEGIVCADPARPDGPIGRMLIQPDVENAGVRLRLDDAIGPWWAVIGLNRDPRDGLDEVDLAEWTASGAVFVRINRSRASEHFAGAADGVLTLADVEGKFRDWQMVHRYDVLFVRPDRYLAGASMAAGARTTSAALRRVFAAQRA